MKKRRHLPVDTSDYFKQPCPVLSANNAEAIRREIAAHEWVVEYGLGASTLYFLEGFRGRYIAVENNIHWFYECVAPIEQAGFTRQALDIRRWTPEEKRHFMTAPPAAASFEGKMRLPVWREKLATGPFFRFSPLCKTSRLRGRLGPLWPVMRPLFTLLNTLFGGRETEAVWRGTRGDAALTLINIPPSLKDQHGEAPNCADYVQAGLRDISAELGKGVPVKAVFVIDGGPRMKIVEAIMDLRHYAHFTPTIILCDAWRGPYAATLSKHGGTFWGGTNRTVKGDIIIPNFDAGSVWVGDAQNIDDLLKKEVWALKA